MPNVDIGEKFVVATSRNKYPLSSAALQQSATLSWFFPYLCLAAPALGLKLFLAGSLKERLCPIVEKKARVATLIRLGRRLSSRIGDLMCESVSA